VTFVTIDPRVLERREMFFDTGRHEKLLRLSKIGKTPGFAGVAVEV
jgi:hypothetical protein